MSVDTDETRLDRITAEFEKMEASDIVIAPWLAMNDGEERIHQRLQAKLKKTAAELAAQDTEAQVFWVEFDVNSDFRERAYYEILLSTAAYLSHMRLGTLVITEEMASVATSLLRDYLERNGGSALLSVYARVITYLNNKLLLYYGEVPEDKFLSGEWHRPWVEYSLEYELQFALQYEFFERVARDGQSFVRLTEAGKQLYEECWRDLEQCGYLRQHEQLLRANGFTNMDDYEKIMDTFNPGVHEDRRRLIQWTGIHSGMRVLELGCGAGALTLDDGLYQAVGKQGSVVATDPSIGMLQRAKQKLSRYDAANVVFRQAAAEKIPFPDNSFDCVTGMWFLHFTEIPRALKEIARVTREGGRFVTVAALNFSQKEDFFIEWFEPVFKMGLAMDAQDPLPEPEFIVEHAKQHFTDVEVEIEMWDVDFSNVENTVKFIINAGLIAETTALPWRARQTLIEELIGKGYELKDKYGAENMKHRHRGLWLKGTVLK
ncbi:methyltransferase domain-containing protein [Alicyclobacillus sp. SO9]|uniref:methyltransferase domain-containing protein n=1 Tax=Alicyclobacillus sp. SO9 TaxID=2665646 RepID=UPI0018E77826|nr:methyltransferase domain-containing protein [Alicyclobacillus sp. SO9]QQE78249.1 methyltransferase domain-containing protein [Alicyclobacillus sp. SO9]